jgi:hypothetical protein
VRAAVAMLLLIGCDGADRPCECRGDETCVADECIPWAEAPLAVDFTLTVDGQTITCEVAPGGFPRERVEALRFSFGDGFAGYGERIDHTYVEPGVYAVDLEVRLEGYRVVRASRLAVVGDAATRIDLTVNDTPAYLNGSRPARSDAGTPDPSDDVDEPFHLLLPAHGFTVDVTLLEAPGAEVDLATLQLDASGVDRTDRLELLGGGTDRVRRLRWTVGPEDAFAPGMVTLALAGEQLTFEVVDLTADRDPFDRPMAWLLLVDEDRFTESAAGDGSIAISAGPDGRIDLDRELELIGGQGSDAAANAAFRRWVVDAIVTEILRYYRIAPDGTPRAGIDFAIHVAGDPGAPAPADFAATGEFSMMRLGGTLGVNLGRSEIAAWNQDRVDDTSDGLGVATGTILSTVATTAGVIEELYPILPGVGVAVGAHPADAAVLAADFDRWARDVDPEQAARWDDLHRIARRLGEAIGAVTAHEMGHAMGLVPDGAPPCGLFGGRPDIDFMGDQRTDSHHADFPGLNLMQAGNGLVGALADGLDWIEVPDDYRLIDLALVFSQENRLSPYELAYMQRRLTHAAFEGCP